MWCLYSPLYFKTLTQIHLLPLSHNKKNTTDVMFSKSFTFSPLFLKSMVVVNVHSGEFLSGFLSCDFVHEANNDSDQKVSLGQWLLLNQYKHECYNSL